MDSLPLPACPAGDTCPRQSDTFHRRSVSHPCRYGMACYRQNPQHFQQFHHPPSHPKHKPPRTTAVAAPTDHDGPQLGPANKRSKTQDEDGVQRESNSLVDVAGNFAKEPPSTAVKGQQSLLLEDVCASLSISVTDSSDDPAVLARRHASGKYVESVEFDFDDIEVWVEADDDHREATEADFNCWALAAKAFYLQAEDDTLHAYTAPIGRAFFTVRELLQAVQAFEQVNRHLMGYLGAIDECHIAFEGLQLDRHHDDGHPVFRILYGS
eukprot:TRINITY_DN2257_c0_g1_i1.p1 TRINITY_DN2257_c0_g1~~TRINITY_DN2257_c0_g1_i1.p1  ORF type:complete len:268 (+),score=43.51 TRINITY_DN2257_c0_g1_i1:260-1063(+)